MTDADPTLPGAQGGPSRRPAARPEAPGPAAARAGPKPRPGRRTRRELRERARRVAAVLAQHLPPLQARIRAPVIAELARRLVLTEPPLGDFERQGESERLVALCVRLPAIVSQLEVESSRRESQFREFSRLYATLTDPRERKRCLRAFLVETVRDRRRLRGDLKAIKRFLGLDVLRERHDRLGERHRIVIELALLFVARAIDAAFRLSAVQRDDGLDSLIVTGRIEAFLAERASRGPRWQNRLAAVEGLVTLYRWLLRSERVERVAGPGFATVAAIAAQADEHPFVQAQALELALALPSAQGRQWLQRRLLDPAYRQGARDFLVRRKVVDLLAQAPPAFAASGLLAAAVAGGEPSEHVRMGLAAALAPGSLEPGAEQAADAFGRLCRRPAAGAPGESSPRVRAEACRALLATGLERLRGGDHPGAGIAVARLCRALAGESDGLPLRQGSEALAEFFDEATPFAVPAELASLAGPALQALASLRGRAEQPAAIHEAAAQAAERIARALDPLRRRYHDWLRGVTQAIRPGRRRRVAWRDRPQDMPAVPADPRWLGRLLAELSVRDWGLSAEPRGDGVVLWRGDRMRRRLWRILHELTHRAPSKRQGFLHTVGRSPEGSLRAPPAGLDEVSPTTVPGERVHIDAEGGWGRHLPTVDDALDVLSWRRRPLHLFSSHGVTTVQGPPRLWRRLAGRLGATFRYAALGELRLGALRGSEPRERRRFLDVLQQRYGIAASFQPYDYPGFSAQPVSPPVAALFPAAAHTLGATAVPRVLLAVPGLSGLWERVQDWVRLHDDYLLSPVANTQPALAVFLAGVAAWLLIGSYRKRRRIAAARQALPLCIGGWGTRGKSGTERIKAGLFHGLGFEVFVKTTGCEAMFIHSVPGQAPLEVFLFRPYDKATIWEQRDMVQLGAGLHTEVFLWECMGLNPDYIRILQRRWMKDDLVTLTNAYPDHENIQGPAGADVAEVIAGFTPARSTLVTSETHFLPLFAERCRERHTSLVAVPLRDAELIPQDLLDLFPYQEHPHNIALVARLAEQLGVDPQRAIVLMAEHVVPDIGVLKAYPTVRLRGRQLTFINGHSANERTGFLNNWRRTGCDRLDVEQDPGELVLGVVNNRADRISRSQVFAQIMVEDMAADGFVLIGTNLNGLIRYLRDALARFSASLEVIAPDDAAAAADAAPAAPGVGPPFERLARHLARLRIARPTPAALLARLRLCAAALGRPLPEPADRPLESFAALAALLQPAADAPTDVASVRRELQNLPAVRAALTAWLPDDAGPPPPADPPEVLAPPTGADAREGFLRQFARLVVHARLQRRLAEVVRDPTAQARAAFHDVFREAYRRLFMDALTVLPDPDASGDQVIDRCARAVMPGTRVRLMGMQNIKGTGLDFVYRWIAYETVSQALDRLTRADARERLLALQDLQTFEDYGLIDAGRARVVLSAYPAPDPTPDERASVRRVYEQVDAVFEKRARSLAAVRGPTVRSRLLRLVERAFDFIDSVRRFRRSRRILKDLVHERISHRRAALEMRQLHTRQKGGWLFPKAP